HLAHARFRPVLEPQEELLQSRQIEMQAAPALVMAREPVEQVIPNPIRGVRKANDAHGTGRPAWKARVLAPQLLAGDAQHGHVTVPFGEARFTRVAPALAAAESPIGHRGSCGAIVRFRRPAVNGDAGSWPRPKRPAQAWMGAPARPCVRATMRASHRDRAVSSRARGSPAWPGVPAPPPVGPGVPAPRAHRRSTGSRATRPASRAPSRRARRPSRPDRRARAAGRPWQYP